MSVLTESIERSQAVANTAFAGAMRLKQSGFLDEQMTPGLAGGMDFGMEQIKSRRQYGLFRGWLYSAVNALAMEAAGQPVAAGRLSGSVAGRRTKPSDVKNYHLKKMTKTARGRASAGELEVLTDHPLLDALERPNPFQHRWQFVYSFVANLNLTGWAYIVGSTDKEGRTEFYSLPTTWVHPEHADGSFGKFRISNPKRPEQKGELLDRSQVAFAHLPNPSDPLSALAPVTSQLSSIRVDDHIQTSQERFFENGVFPSVVITVGKEPLSNGSGGTRPRLSPPQWRQIVGAINRRWRGVKNYGHPAVIDGMIESITRMSATQNEMGWEKSENKVRDRILSAFCVPPYVLGAQVPGSYAAAYVTKELFCDRVNTFLDMLGSVMSNFVAAEGSDKLLVWWEKCVPQDRALRSRELTEARRCGDITRNEHRAELGFPPAEAGEAERSTLLDTVGGMNGAAQFFNSMRQGAMTPDAVARLMSLFFRIPLEEARTIVGGSDAQTLAAATGELRTALTMLRPKALADAIVEDAK